VTKDENSRSARLGSNAARLAALPRCAECNGYVTKRGRGHNATRVESFDAVRFAALVQSGTDAAAAYTECTSVTWTPCKNEGR
jgi:hypothetical protein